MMLEGKKGIFFTVVSVLIVTVILTSVAQQGKQTITQKESGGQARVETANNYIKDLKNQYIAQAVYSAGYAALDNLSYQVAAMGFFASEQDFLSAFRELALQGTINSIPVKEMKDRTIINKLGEIESKSMEVYKINITIDKSPADIGLTVSQTNRSGQFMVETNITLNFNVSLPDARTRWTYNKETITTYFGIDGIKDPLYLRKSNYKHGINVTRIDDWDINMLYNHLESMTYRKEQSAPSFLMRYYFKDTGIFNSLYGIESLVNPNKIAVGSVAKTYADWCFYSLDKCAKDPPLQSARLWTVNDARFPPTFKMDTAHTTAFNMEGQVTEYIAG